MHDDFFDEIIRARETGAVDFTPILWARCLSLTVLRSRRTTVSLDTHSLSSQVLRKSFLRARPSAGTLRREASASEHRVNLARPRHRRFCHPDPRRAAPSSLWSFFRSRRLCLTWASLTVATRWAGCSSSHAPPPKTS